MREKIELAKILKESVFQDMIKDPLFREILPKDVDEK